MSKPSERQELNQRQPNWVRIEDGIATRNGRVTIDIVIDGKRIRKAVKANTLPAARRMRDAIIQRSLGKLSEREANRLFHRGEQEWSDVVAWLKGNGFLRKKFLDLKRSANERGIPFTASEREIEEIIIQSNGRCALTGIPLEVGTSTRHPFKMSIDRIKASEAYKYDNLRVVCFSVNVAIGEWGDSVLEAISMGYMQQRVREASKTIGSPENHLKVVTQVVTQRGQSGYYQGHN